MIHDLARSGLDGSREAFDKWIYQMTIRRENPLKEAVGLQRTYWHKLVEAADKYNQPGRFTAFIGFEWTSGPNGNNLHRNVVFRDGGDKAKQIIPISQYESFDPEVLWQWMADYEQKTGGRLLAIPHNGNLSNGLMFDVETFTGGPITKEYAERRMKWEPVYEITQMKGTGETHPRLSPDDEFADFELWDKGSFGPQPKTAEMLPREYAREALKRGLAYEQSLGANPFKFGVIGSTDAHTGLASTEEDNYFGKVTPLEPSADPIRFEEPIIGRAAPAGSQILAAQVSSGALAAVWARENTREAIWDAFARKEVFATTGTRLRVRVFGGFGFQADDLVRSDFPAYGYQKGVPMGGDLRTAPTGKSPAFLVRAIRDPDGANLDRVQIIKGWLDAQGKTHERIWDVAVSGKRSIDQEWPLPHGGRKHRECRGSHVHQRHRVAGDGGFLAGSAVRPATARVLLCAGHRDPDTPLDDLRRENLRRRASRGRAVEYPRACVHQSDLVFSTLATLQTFLLHFTSIRCHSGGPVCLFSFARALAVLLLVMAGSQLGAQQRVTTDAGTIDAETMKKYGQPRPYSPYAGRNFPDRPLWGELHLHTLWSADAVGGGCRLGPEAAYRFARGEEVVSSTGQPVRLSRSLDWLAIADHSDAMGVISDVIAGKPEFMQDPQLRRWNGMFNAGPDQAMAAVMEMITAQGSGQVPPALIDPNVFKDVWRRYTALADEYNDPGRFTTLIAYEWTPNPGGGNNLHRNVIYRDGADMASRLVPLTTFQTENPEDLWKWMETYESQTGGDVLAIPHNGNLSNGRMFAVETFDGQPLTKAWAETRIKWERLYEVTQGKGTSEQHPSLAPNDEFASFEIWDKGNLNVVPKKPGMLDFEYAREAFKHGLEIQSKLGVNPFKFGLAGSTDSHNGLTAAEENNFFGKFPPSEPSPERWDEDAFSFDGRVVKGWELGASGYTAVWANTNTREAIWDALHRRETYATTGPRILVRFFGGFDFTAEDAENRQPAATGYAKGVPMGADLPTAPKESHPRSWSWPSRTVSAATWTGFRSSRVGWTKVGKPKRRSTTSLGGTPIAASWMPKATSPRSATPSMCKRRPGRTRSEIPS